MKLAGCWPEGVVHPQPLLARSHQTRAAQIGQVPRHLRLRNAQHDNKITDARLTATQQVQQAKPGAVGERPEHPVYSIWLFHLHSHKRIYARSERRGQVVVECELHGTLVREGARPGMHGNP